MMAHAYTEPAATTSAAVPNHLMPAILAMAQRQARHTAELDTMRARV